MTDGERTTPYPTRGQLAGLLRTLIALQLASGALIVWTVLSVMVPGWAPSWRGVVTVLLGPLTPIGFVLICTLICAAWAGLRPWSAQDWKVLAGESLLALRLFWWRQARAAPGPLHIEGPPGGPPVLLVHGYFCNHRIWDELAHDLLARGYRVARVDLEPLFASIDAYVATIDTAVRALRPGPASAPLAMVGHSMGGLALRAWMRQHGSADVACVLTLGTPHAGTRLARLAQTPNGRQMEHGSRWLTELQTTETPQTLSRLRIALSAHDTVVFPQTAQTLPGASVTRLDGLGHLQLCQHPRARAWVLEQLRNDLTPR